MSAACDCGLPARYAQCCGRWHAGEPAPSAEALMRSRYSAFVRGDAAYLLLSWHASTRPASLDLDARIKWLGLTVKAQQLTGPDRATVEFIARSRLGGGPAERQHEVSRFVREQDRWFYLDAQG